LPYYESVLIARPDISGAQVDGLAESFTKVIEEGGGKITKTENWGLKGLAFRIKKNRKGHYLLMNIDSPAPALHEMERQMRLHEDVLRFITIRVDELEEGPSAMLRSRDRDDRGPRGGRGRHGDGPPRDRDRGRGPRDDAKPAAAAEEAPTDAKPEATPETKPEAKPEAKGDEA